MNVLYFFEYSPTPNRGGASRLTNSLVNYWSNSDFIDNIFCAYLKKEKDYVSYFKKDIQVSLDDKKSFELFLSENKVSIILYQMGFSAEYLDFILSCNKKNIPIITTYHSMPGWELLHIRNNLFNNNSKSLKDLIKKNFNFLYGKYLRRIVSQKNKYIYNHSTKYIVLSESYIDLYKRINGIRNGEKLCSISNPLSYPIVDISNTLNKEKIVLVVGRFSESEKRFLLVIKSWELLKKRFPRNDWKLYFIGYGPDEYIYIDYIRKNNLKDIVFLGKQDPKEYYKKSSIFLMTSTFEGFPLTLTESQQFGVVPIVMNSFPAVNDIIKNNYNGFIVANNDITEMVEKIEFLMTNEDKRIEMGINANRYIRRFSLPNIAKKWEELFKEVVYGVKD